jgi:hypothetical protein
MSTDQQLPQDGTYELGARSSTSRSLELEDIPTEEDGTSSISRQTQYSDGPGVRSRITHSAELEDAQTEEGRASGDSQRTSLARYSESHQNAGISNQPVQIERKPVPINPSPQPRSPQKGHSWLPSRWNNWWFLEIGAAVLSLAFMMAVVGVLLAIHGKPLADWGLPIRPNSLISVFVTLSKASMLLTIEACISQLKWLHFEQAPHLLDELQTFDSASRGPLGSLLLIWKMRGRAIVASTGAFITIVALAVDPFAQQIISYPSVPTSIGNLPSSLQATQIYDTGYTVSPLSGSKSRTLMTLRCLKKAAKALSCQCLQN